MKKRPEVDQPTEEHIIYNHARFIRARFEAAWQETLKGGQLPTIEMVLGDTPEPERTEIRVELERIDREYRTRAGGADRCASDATVEIDSSGNTSRTPPASAADSTTTLPLDEDDFALQEIPPERPDATLDFVPGGAPLGSTPDPRATTVEPNKPGPSLQPGKPSGPCVANYEILGELGRGGMGVVYKARQLGLNRVVALKMVLAGAHASPEQLARFHIEAEAVARLQHPNIVQIYEVGEQDGLPFFSLEYVDGVSLAKLIGGDPQPPKKAAQLMAMLAHGVYYAHQNGIVHRDLKPANILLTSDGMPKITDFGLAKRLEEGAVSQTQSGTLMGTPSYMAPEQARGDVRQLGPPADVYSLGAILYEMLTGRPPFMASTMLETLEQVRSQEPVPPSHLIPKTPPDLETICLKCLQKEVSKRYTAALALAEDLDRFLAGEPIHARPVSSPERLWRWCKRNPRIAGLTAAIFLLLVAGVIVSSAFAITIAEERNQKEQERQAADDARQLAEQRKLEADGATAQAQKNAAEALKQGQLALRAFGTLIDEVPKQIGDNPGMQGLKAKLLETALEGLDKVAKSDEDARLLGQSMAAAYMKMGQLFQQIGQSEKAFAQYQKCHAIIKALAEKDPNGDVAMANLAATYTMLGEMSLELRRDMQTSLDYYQKALQICKDLSQRVLSDKLDATKVKQEFAESYTRVGVTFLRLGDPEKALEYFHEALRLREELAAATPANLPIQLDVARSHNALGEVRFRARDWHGAREHFGKALATCQRVQATEPTNPRYKFELANTLGNFGVFDVRTGDLPAAQEHYGRYLALMQEIAALDAKNALYQRYLGLANYRLAALARRLKDPDTAERCNRKCLEIREKLAAADPSSERRKIELLLVLPRCGQHARAAEEAAKVQSGKNADREVLVEVAQCYAQCAAFIPDDSGLRQRYTDAALAALQQASQQGFKDQVFLETEPDLDSLRMHPGFDSILAKLKPR